VVVLREAIIREDEIGLDERGGGEIVAHERGEKSARLLLHGFHEVIVEAVFRVEADVRFVAPHLAETEPVVGEVFHEAREAFAGNEALRLGAQGGRFAQMAGAREAGELGIGARVGEEMREACGDGELRIGAFRLAQVEELAGAEEGLVTGQHRLGEGHAIGEARDD